MSWRGVFSGALALIFLEAVLRSDESAGRFGQMLEGLGDIARKVLSPAVAAIPDIAGGSGVAGGSGGSGGGSGGFSGGGGGGNGGGQSW